MFHGAPKPSGFSRTYPHAITREAVLGSEYNMWSAKATPKHNVTLPFTRMLSGPMDYEPGLLNNATSKSFRAVDENVMSFGTRANQLAMYVVYDSPIQFFSGNPSQGMPVSNPDWHRVAFGLFHRSHFGHCQIRCACGCWRDWSGGRGSCIQCVMLNALLLPSVRHSLSSWR